MYFGFPCFFRFIQGFLRALAGAKTSQVANMLWVTLTWTQYPVVLMNPVRAPVQLTKY
jgi:hypothetical protein